MAFLSLLALLVAAAPDVYPHNCTYKQGGTGSVTRACADKFADALAAKEFGAKCDGATDDAPALALANTAAVAQGKAIFIGCKLRIASAAGTVAAGLRFEGAGALDLSPVGGSVTLTGPLTAPVSQVFYTGSGTLTFSAKVAQVVPQWWGAKGDGVTDDTAAFTAAAAALSSGGTLLVPAGSFKLTSTFTITQPIVIRGTGYGSRIFGDPGNTPLITISAANVSLTDLRLSNTHVQTASEASYHVIKITKAASSVYIQRNTLDQGRGISNVGPSMVWIEDNTFSGMRDFGVTSGCDADLVTCTLHLYVRRNRFSGGTTSGVSGPPHDINYEDTSYSEAVDNDIDDGAGFTEAGASCIKASVNHSSGIQKIRFEDNHCLKSSSVGVYNGMAVSSALGTVKDVSFSRNKIEGYLTGILVAEAIGFPITGTMVTNNIIRNAQSSGIALTGSTAITTDVTISGNEVTGPGNLATGSNGILVQNISGYSVIGNRVTGSASHGIYVDTSSNGLVSGNATSDNGQFDAGDGIRLHIATNNAVVGNRSFDDQGVPTQGYGINILAGSGNYMGANAFAGNVTAAYADTGSTVIMGGSDHTYKAAGDGSTVIPYIFDTISGAVGRVMSLRIAGSEKVFLSSTGAWNMNNAGGGLTAGSTSSNFTLTLAGSRTAADVGADNVLRGLNTRTAGHLTEIWNGGTVKWFADINGGGVQSGVTFANIGTGSTANGTLLYCSDCTIANPCASGGTGAFAKRLNGVWVCN